MKKLVGSAALALCAAVAVPGCRGLGSDSAATPAGAVSAATEFTAMTPPVRNTARVSHVTARAVKKATVSEYKLDLSGVQAPYAKEIEYYTEKALAFDSALTSMYFTGLRRNDGSGKLEIKVSLTVTPGASGRRGTRYRPCYTLTAFENGEQIWTVQASCESVVRDLSKINGWLPGIVASARMYIGQNRTAPLQAVTKYPEFLTALGAL